jgi:hypothetical protein
MPGSGAGSNLLSGYLLSNLGPNTAVVATPTVAYGALGVNDSGGFAVEARAVSKWRIQLEQVGTAALVGYGVSIYVTSSPAAFQTYMYALQGRTPTGVRALPFGGSPQVLANAAAGFFPGIDPGMWVLAEGPSDQGGTGPVANPLTPTSPQLTISGTIVAIRAVLTASAAPVGNFNVSLLGIP